MKKTCIALFALLIWGCSKEDVPPTPGIPCNDYEFNAAHPLGSNFQNILEAYINKGFPGISAAVYTPRDGLWLGSAGKVSLESHQGMATCNAFFSGSVAKMYTVTAAMLLHEAGMLPLDAPISDYLPLEVVNQLPNGQTATVQQLMDHSAGMPDHDDEPQLNQYNRTKSGPPTRPYYTIELPVRQSAQI